MTVILSLHKSIMLDAAGNSPLKISKVANIEGDMSEKTEDKAL